MIATFQHESRVVHANLGQPIDLSLPIRDQGSLQAWYLGPPRIEAHRDGDFVGSLQAGAPVNFRDVFFNPHAHGTHTETLWHIHPTEVNVNQVLEKYFFFAQLISLTPEARDGDHCITKAMLAQALGDSQPEAVLIRTLPNPEAKRERDYDHTNWPYLLGEATAYLAEIGVMHLLVDLPSVDKEKDNGRLEAHKAFWQLGASPREKATITEFLYIPEEVSDGEYLLELQLAPLVNDASPSRPVIYPLQRETST